MKKELNYLSEKIQEQENEIIYYENESRKAESESLRQHWTECIEIHKTEIELLNNILNKITDMAL